MLAHLPCHSQRGLIPQEGRARMSGGQRKAEYKRSNPGVAASHGRMEHSTHALKFTLMPKVYVQQYYFNFLWLLSFNHHQNKFAKQKHMNEIPRGNIWFTYFQDQV